MADRKETPEFPTGRAAVAAARAQAGAKRAAAGKAAARKAAEEAAKAGPRPPRRGGRVASPRFDAFAADVVLRHDDIDEGDLFGMPCLRVRGKAFAGWHDGGVVFKLPKGRYDEIAALPGTAPYEPQSKGRASGTWLLVPSPYRQRWRELADDAIAFVSRGG